MDSDKIVIQKVTYLTPKHFQKTSALGKKRERVSTTMGVGDLTH